MKYLNTKPGSIEEIAANMSKHQNESGYQDMFKKELEKAGKGIGSMTPAEKKAFFNKIDDKYKAKNEDIKEEVSQKDVDKFHTKLDKLVHKSFGHSSDEKKKEVKEEDAYDKDDEKPKSKPKKDEKNEEKDIPKGYHKMPDGTIMKDSEHKKETHTFMTKDMNKSKKDAKGEKEIVDPEPKLKQESIQDTIANVWKMSAEELEKIKTEAKYMKAQRMSQYKAEDEKNKKGTADTGSKATKVDVEPKVDYKN
jgi:hypothetical protein